jgi:hypothetical protein
MRTFVTRLVDVYHETLAHICIIVRSYLMFTPIVSLAWPASIICLVSSITSIYFLYENYPFSQHPFPFFGVQMRSAFEDAFAQIGEQVAPDHPSIGIHVWNLGNVLNQSLTIDRLHPTVEGHVALGEALVRLVRPLVGDP